MNLKSLFKNPFIQGILALFVGSAFAQAIPVLISPVLTRVYSPADFALLSIYLSVLNTLAIVITGRYELAIVLPKSEKTGFYVFKLSIYIATFVSFFFLVFFLLFSRQLSVLLGNPQIQIWLQIVAFPLFLMGIFQSVTYWLTREKRYSLISKIRLIQSCFIAGISILLGFWPLVNGGLIIGNIAGLFISVCVALPFIWKNLDKKYLQKSKARLISLSRQYKDFPKYNAFSSVVNTIGIYIPLWYISASFDSTITGNYGLATRVVAIPLVLFSSSIAPVYYKKATDLFNNREDLYGFTKNLFLKSFYFSIAPLIGFAVLAPDIFVFVFGNEWHEAGRMTQYIALGLFSQVIISPITIVFAIINKLKVVMIWQILYLLANLLIVFINKSFFQNGLNSYLIQYTIMNVLLYTLYLFLILSSLKKTTYA